MSETPSSSTPDGDQSELQVPDQDEVTKPRTAHTLIKQKHMSSQHTHTNTTQMRESTSAHSILAVAETFEDFPQPIDDNT